MLTRFCTFTLLAAAAYAQTDTAALVKAQRDREDQQWSRTSGLSIADIQALRQLAGISDPAFGSRILALDATSLKQRKHVLFAEMGNGHCMRVHVLERASSGFTEVWSLSELPRHSWSPPNRSGNGICTQSPKGPRAHATPDGRIVIEVPTLTDPFSRTLPVSTYSFTWTGSKYELVDQDSGAVPQQAQPHEMVLNLVAVDRHGRPLTDLTQAEPQVFDNAKPQQIASLRRQDTPATQPAAGYRWLHASRRPAYLQQDVTSRLNATYTGLESLFAPLVVYPGRKLSLNSRTMNAAFTGVYSPAPPSVQESPRTQQLCLVKSTSAGGGDSPVRRAASTNHMTRRKAHSQF